MINETSSWNQYPRTIAIIGAGFSGSLVAANLLQTATYPLCINLIEKQSEIGRGVAYSTPESYHLLNVPAGKMSAFEKQPDRFINWLHDRGYEQLIAASFVPRYVYGDYIQAVLKEAEIKAIPDAKLLRIMDEVTALETTAREAQIYLRSGRCLSAQKVVLALGNFPAALPEPIAILENCDRYVRDGWCSDPIAQLSSEDAILIIGTGLTMIDVVLSLRKTGFPGKIYAISRHGLMPVSHKPAASYPKFLDLETAPKTTREILHLIRKEARLAETQGRNWQEVINTLRPITQQLWQALPIQEKQRFLRHVKVYWEIHRHRIAEEIAEEIDIPLKSGQLTAYAGRIMSCQALEDRVAVTIRERRTQRERVLLVKQIINCTGSNCNYRTLQHPLLLSLQDRGLIRLNSLSIGIDTAPNGALLDAKGQPSEQLYTLGPPRKGNLWETTAVPEIRVQAASLAQELTL